MNNFEFSNEFDVLLNSYKEIHNFGLTSSPTSIELDEYEKSVLLTLALEDLVIEYYSGKNPFNESFEKTEEIRRYLQLLVNSYETSNKVTINKKIYVDSVFFNIPEDVMFIVYESVNLLDDKLKCGPSKEGVLVKPVTHDEFNYIMRNSFRRPNENKVLRLDVLSNNVELISYYNIDKYFMRYIGKPTPIVLEDMEGVSINGINTNTECALHPALHKNILRRAVDLALLRAGISPNKTQ